MNKTKKYFGDSPRVITRLDNECYEYLRYTIGFDNVDEFVNKLVKEHMESRGKYGSNQKQC